MKRRDYLKRTGALAVPATLGVAGCLDDADDGDFPSQTLSWIVPFGEGGGTDTYARQVQGPMQEAFGESIEIDNQPGAGGLNGAQALHGAEPNGYTIGSVNLPSVITSWLVQEPDFDMTEVEGVGSIGRYPFMLIVNPAYDHITDLDELVDAYQDGEFTQFAMQGIGHSTHAIALLLRDEYGMEWEDIVPYDGGGPTNEAVATDEVPVGIATATSALGPSEAGDINVVANLSSSETPVFPDIAPATDLGYPNIDFVSETVLAKFAPPGTDQDRIDVISEAMETAVGSDDVQAWSDDTGNAVDYTDPAETHDLLIESIESIEDSVDLAQLRE
ncbi:tripartite tricarboxylate transporter substrate binding protein [Halorubrum sp. JWXQ-INN 858]|uniref:Bug family tripartite tricarboxylate transporter substrate binding protein n=1 Tax=Halorubrum sp. JWXQ-INN 858 TaxID=2690782 RepID=UPI00135973EC|nr:tripartite tricarboxylate transporter substrate binding protein [Halorubrum sp. JWXQ-INN 858]MWV63407.1 tripartite tricarboxylate transporter substrate binding protein [Halorubrum sp. JWXQ-INN 858]